VTLKTTGNATTAGPRRDVFMIPTDRGFRHAPNSEVVVVHPATPDTPTLYKTNSLGYRNPEIGPKRGERILFLGDSITLGLALNEADTFPRLVEDLARRDGLGWETINAGVNGLGTNGELAVLSETGLSVSPDVVVLGFYLNDFLESPGIYLTRLPGPLERSVLAHQLANVASRLLYLSPSKLEGLIAEFARLSREHRFRFRVVAFPVRHQVEATPLFDYPQRRLREITRALDIPLLDLLPRLRDEHARSKTTDSPMFFDQCHLTPRGSRIVARSMYEFLRETRGANGPEGPRGSQPATGSGG